MNVWTAPRPGPNRDIVRQIQAVTEACRKGLASIQFLFPTNFLHLPPSSILHSSILHNHRPPSFPGPRLLQTLHYHQAETSSGISPLKALLAMVDTVKVAYPRGPLPGLARTNTTMSSPIHPSPLREAAVLERQSLNNSPETPALYAATLSKFFRLIVGFHLSYTLPNCLF